MSMKSNLDIWAVGFMTVAVLASSFLQARPVRTVTFSGAVPALDARAVEWAQEVTCQAAEAVRVSLGS
jgi:hypothetical protein